MKTKSISLLLALMLLLTACGSPPAETTAPAETTVPTTAPVETTAPPATTEPPVELTRYPLNADSTYVKLAQELPDHIYTTTGSENGLGGTVYKFTGTVTEYSTTPMEVSAVEQIFVETEGGTVMIGNFYKWLYNSAYLEFGETAANAAYPYPVESYQFPAVGETAEFIAIYLGYSGVAKVPMFYLGANPALFELEDYPDPAQTTNTDAEESVQPVGSAEPGTKENPYLAGTYKVGTDIPAGEYLFVITDTAGGYVCVSADSNKDDIIENEIVELCWFATVKDGQYLEVRDCAFLHAEKATLNINEDGSFVAGMYRVGIDIPAGEYKLTTDDMGYWCIYKDSVVPFDIISNDLFEGSAYVTVKDGQYIITSDCTAVPVK